MVFKGLSRERRYSIRLGRIDGLVVLLLIALSVQSAHLDWRLGASLAHGASLGCLYLIAAEVTRFFSGVVSRGLALLVGGWTLLKILILQATGFHINGFLMGAIIQLDRAEWRNILESVPLSAYLLVVLAIASAIYVLRHPSRRDIWRDHTVFRRLFVISLAFQALTQGITAFQFYEGDPRATTLRRDLAYAAFPHPYYIRRVAELFLSPESRNPFATDLQPRFLDANPKAITYKPFKTAAPPNIVLLVIDSLRGEDIGAIPELLPSLAANPALTVDFQHNATSNCTHFSLYSLYSGKYPDQFSAARARGFADSITGQFAATGYDIGVYAANTLHWYDTQKILYGEIGTYWEAPAASIKERDEAAIAASLNALNARQSDDPPFFMLSYLFGTHWPFSTATETGGEFGKYRASIGALEPHIAALLGSAEALEQRTGRKTIVIITSDHGDEGREGDEIGHSSKLNDRQTLVPFAVQGIMPSYPLPKAHIYFRNWLTALIEASPYSPPTEPLMMQGCAYDYPQEMAVVLPEGRAHFALKGGYVAPLTGPDGQIPSPALIKTALPFVLDRVKKR